jgi:glycosyltransferase involved in cell wall biosynthesis
MSLHAILSRIGSGEAVPSAELLPYLCLERREQRATVNHLLAEAYWKSGREEFRTFASVSIKRAWLLSGFSPEVLPLYTEIHSALDDIPAIREAYKRLGIAAAERGDVTEAIRYFDQWQYAYHSFKNLDKYEYDFDVLAAIDGLAQPYRLSLKPRPDLGKDGKIRIAYLVKGIRELGSVLVRFHLVYAKFHDRAKIAAMFFVPESEQEVLASEAGRQHVEQFRELGYDLKMAPNVNTPLARLLAVAEMIRGENADVLVTGAALATFEHCFLTALRPAPFTVGFVAGPPEQFAPLTLDWGISWSKHPLIDCPVSCALMDMESEMVERANVIPLARTELGIPDDGVILGTAGRYVKFQEFQFWEAVIQLLIKHPNLYYLAMGVDEEQVPFLSSLVTPETRNRIRFRPWQGEDYLSALALVQIYLDTFPSGGGTVLHDVVSLSIPVISFENNYMRVFDQVDWSSADVLDMPEILVPRGDFDEMKRFASDLINDPQRRRELGEMCCARLRETRATPERSVRRFEEILARILKEELAGNRKPDARELEVADAARRRRGERPAWVAWPANQLKRALRFGVRVLDRVA